MKEVTIATIAKDISYCSKCLSREATIRTEIYGQSGRGAIQCYNCQTRLDELSTGEIHEIAACKDNRECFHQKAVEVVEKRGLKHPR